MKDKIVEKVKELLDSRSKVGIIKYNSTLDENIKDNYLQHALEEALDLSNYLVAFKEQMSELCKRYPNDQMLGEIIRSIYENKI